MAKRVFFVSISVCLCMTVAACGPSQAEIDRYATEVVLSIYATQTAEAPTPTPTFTPTATPTPTPTQRPLPDVWQEHSSNNFSISLPENWKIVDVEKESIEAILQFLKTFNSEWAQNAASMFTVEGMQDLIKFWAIDPEPAGVGYASTNITYQPYFLPSKAKDLCTIMPSVYERLGVELLDAKCDLEINGVEAARFTIHMEAGPLGIQEYQYIFIQIGGRWTVTTSVDETAWAEYEPIFSTIAESFRIE
jgi:hypothetical protein